jgi:hypothetical protein
MLTLTLTADEVEALQRSVIYPNPNLNSRQKVRELRETIKVIKQKLWDVHLSNRKDLA